MKRKLISLVLISMMVLGLAGCKKSLKDLEYIKDKGELVIGLDDTFAPMGFRDDKDNIVGFDIDLAQAVCDKLGVKLVKQPISWDAKEQELNTKNIDCIWNGLSITKDNQAKMRMTDAYMLNELTFVVTNNSTVAAMSDLAGKKIAVQSGSSSAQTLDSDDNKKFKDTLGTINQFNDYNAALMDLETGNSDAVLMDSVVANYMITEAGKDYKVLGDTLLEDKYGIGFRKGDKELCDAVWNALKELKEDGTIETISTKWFGSDITIIK